MAAKLPKPHGLLTPLQKIVLSTFSQIPDQGQFYLTGGTALSEYYLGHRISYDIDLFTSVDGLILPVSHQLENLSRLHNLIIQPVRRLATYVEFLITHEQETLKVDLALDSPFRFESTVSCATGFFVNNFTDLCVDKLLAYYGRSEPRDAVDLFFILQEQSAELLLNLAREKDPGFDLYWFSIALNRCQQFPDEGDRWPVDMLVEWDPKVIKNSFHSWAIQLLEDMAH